MSRLCLKVFSDENGAMWKKSVKDIDGDVLCVSQFSLLANTTKGNKPDFHRAMVRVHVWSILTARPDAPAQSSESSKEMYASFLDRMRSLYKPEKIQGTYVTHLAPYSLPAPSAPHSS